MFSHSYCCTDSTTTDDVSSLTENTFISNPDLPVDDVNIKILKDEGMQCDPDPLLVENMALKKEVEELQKEVIRHKWSFQKISDDDSKTRFYTGLPSFAVFMWLFSILRPKAERTKYWSGPNTDQSSDRKRGSLDLIDQLFAVLIRLHVGLLTSDIAERFQISESTFSKYFSSWICLLWQELKCLNPFPSRDIVQRTMPPSFKKRYSSVRVIIDCTEIYIQKPSSLVNQSLTFSNYKHHSTVKFLVGITPSGVISFVSEGWPGKTTDRELTISSSLIDLLDENDSVMADKDFTNRDVLLKKNCQLNIPPFKGSAP